MSSGTFNFTKLVVGDLEKSFAFYRDVCGMTEQQRVTGEIAGRAFSEIILASKSRNAATLILLAYDDALPPAGGDVILGFFTSDLAAFVERATRAGGSLLQPARPVPAMGFNVAFVRDHEGHVLEVIQKM